MTELNNICLINIYIIVLHNISVEFINTSCCDIYHAKCVLLNHCAYINSYLYHCPLIFTNILLEICDQYSKLFFHTYRKKTNMLY